MTADELLVAAKDGKCVTGFRVSDDRMPAAFVCSMQFNRVAPVLYRLKIYRPKPKQKQPWKK
jgi:hypothetical protein